MPICLKPNQSSIVLSGEGGRLTRRSKGPFRKPSSGASGSPSSPSYRHRRKKFELKSYSGAVFRSFSRTLSGELDQPSRGKVGTYMGSSQSKSIGQRRRPVTSLLMPRSSFALADSLVPEDMRLLSQSATAIFNLLVSSLRASFAPDCNLGSC